jgi:predicted CoA-binding protein
MQTGPYAAQVEGHDAYPDLMRLPAAARGVSIITPPGVTAKVVEDAARTGVSYLWMQPGAESAAVVARARALGMEVIADGSCFLALYG